MIDSRFFYISLSAVFLAFTAGILIGVSFGEDILIYNQQEIIENMEQKLSAYQAEVNILEEKISGWEMFQDYFLDVLYPVVLKNYNNTDDNTYGLPDNPENRAQKKEDLFYVTIISDNQERTEETTVLLNRLGINYRTVLITIGPIPALETTNHNIDYFFDYEVDHEKIAFLKAIREISPVHLKGNWSDVDKNYNNLFLFLSVEHEPLKEKMISTLNNLGCHVIDSDFITPDHNNRPYLYSTPLVSGSKLEELPVNTNFEMTFWEQVSLLEAIRNGR